MEGKEMNDIFNDGAILFLDGGMGTQLQARGLKPGEVPELWNLERPDDVRAIHGAYLAAGADVVYSNTFGANAAKYHGAAPLADVVEAGVRLAREATKAAGHGRVALDIGPTGRLLKPSGDFEFDAAYDAFAAEVVAGARAGADLVVIETMGDAYELKAAVLAAKENSSLPILATVALGEDGTLLTGASVEVVAALLEGLRVDMLGFNCGFGPDRMLPYVRRLAQLVTTPIAVKPNAGMPRLDGGRTVFDVGPEEFARGVVELINAGASIVGGCCGTTPAHIAALHAAIAPGKFGAGAPRKCCQSENVANSQEPIDNWRLATGNTGNWQHSRTIITSGSRAVEIPFDDTVIIGERINPTGKKRLRVALEEGDTAYILREAVAQAEAGAHILDVNVGVPGLDEPATLDWAVQAVQGVCDLPLQIDTASPAALERALRHYNGKALINSVNGKEESMAAVMPLMAKYGGVAVALTLDEKGIPPTAEGRVAIARKILERGRKYGLKPSDFVIDVLCLAVSAEPQSANVILEAMRRVRGELGCRTCLGVSNISFGLPARPQLNASFYTLALGAGLSAGIVNPLSIEMMSAYRAFRALTGRDPQCAQWVENAAALAQAASVAASAANAQGGAPAKGAAAPGDGQPGSPVAVAIRRGLKDDAAAAAKAALVAGEDPMSIINGGIVAALEEVGKGFEAKTLFLPQLLMAAEAAGAAFEAIRASGMAGTSGRGDSKPIVMATVKGDIHDIGKNICRALLENYGFRVIDLGRDVPPEKILETARREKAPLVGLSALMTTTVGAMEETIRLIHAELPECKVAVGGAVLTQDYADKIGADFYTKDAMELVRLVEQFMAGLK
jgi:5-methyltetrahydrofolate--homocysteine methyltransferase